MGQETPRQESPRQETGDYFYLVVSRLVSYKKVPLIVEAFNQLGLPLVVIGDGPQMALIRQEDRYEATLEAAITLLPSYTALGMARR